jgi:hypothetical protein
MPEFPPVTINVFPERLVESRCGGQSSGFAMNKNPSCGQLIIHVYVSAYFEIF